jgi:hypothetical protein
MADAHLSLGVHLSKLRKEENIMESPHTSRNKKSEKNKPMEASTRRPIGGFVQTPSSTGRKKGFDPRFESLCGKYEKHYFSRSYSFLGDWIEKEQV